MKTLTLRARRPDEDGRPKFHDRIAIDNALSVIAAGKSHKEKPVWGLIAEMIDEAAEKAGWGKRTDEITILDARGERRHLDWHIATPDFSFEIGDHRAHMLWTELEKLPYEKFFKDGRIVLFGILIQMLRDIAQQLGEVFVETQDGEEQE